MGQINMHVTPWFEKMLARFMRVRKIATKSEAIRIAVKEGVERSVGKGGTVEFHSLRGYANRFSVNPRPRFRNDDDLWNKKT
ncbi:MAG: hypothetical protein A2Z34_08995 [Planctomycetes bacterium RBG_16_59_8]|nr:MAG: hypothetical protein A2Z34_08995 [Planctomycetes bacterium RBG_16_59_8]